MRNIGECYKEKGFYEEAILWFQLAMDETPNVREPRYELGALYHDIQDYENARIFLRSALEIKERNKDYINEESSWNGSIYDLLAISEYFTGHYKEAYENAKKAAEIFPDDPRIKENLELMETTYKENK